MSLSSLSIRRPVLTWVFSIFIVLFGVIGLFQLGVREYPAIDPPVISVSASYRGANAEVVENQITEPLESSLNGIEGVRSITSQSRDGRASISVEFFLGVNIEQAANDVRDRVSRAQRSLPDDADPPAVSKADANSSPILMMTLEWPGHSLLDLSAQAVRIQERLQTVSGVAEVAIWGERRKSIRLRIDPAKLASANLTLQDVRNVLKAENVELPAGQLDGVYSSVSLRAETGLVTSEQFMDLALKQSGTGVVRLGDVATAQSMAENEKTMVRVNGIPMLSLAVVPQPGANQIQIADDAIERALLIMKDMPAGLKLTPAVDNTRYVRMALAEVEETILIAFLLVVLIIFLFLRDWRTTLIPVVTIPISLIGAFAILWAMDFSINVLTLLGVVLAIGMVVDDAIVVLENVYSKIEKGLSPREAAVQGVQEIFFAVVSTTLVLIAVFMPLLFLQGFTGRLFREFGVMIGGSVLISGFVALTLGGMLSSRLLKHHSQENKFYRWSEPFFVGLQQFYERHLERSLSRPWFAVPIIIASMIIAVIAYQNLQTELAPMEDRSGLSINVTGPEGATYEYMQIRMEQVANIVGKKIPETKFVLTRTSPGSTANTGFVRIMLVDPKERKRSQQQIAQELQRAFGKVDGVRVNVIQEQTIRVGGRASLPVQVNVQAPDLESLKEALPRVLAMAQQDSTFAVVESDLRFTKPQYRVQIDRSKLRDLGVSAMDVAQALQLAFGAQEFGTYIEEGKEYSIIGELDSTYRSSPDGLQDLRIRNNRGELLPVSQLVTLQEEAVPPALFRYNRYVSATVSAGLAEGVVLGAGIERMQNLIRKELGDRFRTELVGTSRDFAESSGSLMQVFMLALLFVYLILAAQFESFRYPFIIMLTVPLALSGALASLWFTGQTLNLFSQIGLVMLVGLVTKNGILIVEFANQRRAAGLPLRHAVAEAAAARLRPILMTTLSTVLGILPVALALGAGSESRSPMGIAVIGGLLVALVLTLLVVPAMTVLLSKEDV